MVLYHQLSKYDFLVLIGSRKEKSLDARQYISSYVPYILNYGYNVENTENSDESDHMVGHDLARLTVPDNIGFSIDEQTRSGKALSELEGSGYEYDTNNLPDSNNEATEDGDVIISESYSYLDKNGVLRTTKDVEDIAFFGLKVPSLNAPDEQLSSAVASKIHKTSLQEKVSAGFLESSIDSPGIVFTLS